MSEQKIAVLIVEDSPVAQLLLGHILESAPGLAVGGTVASGEAALAFLKHTVPDVILMDLNLGGIDGYETTRRIMETQPVPIVICSATVDPSETAATFRALEAGAVAVVAKPPGPGHPGAVAAAEKLVETVTLMAAVKVVRRWARRRRHPVPARSTAFPATAVDASLRVVAMGTSTGGPPVLQTILGALPRDFGVPILIVQHIAPGFLPGLVDWLGQTTGYTVQIAVAGEVVRPGRAYLAPDAHHLGLGADGRVQLSRDEPENGLRPAVSRLFRSVASACGSRSAGVLLTGMGADGAEDLRTMRNLGAITFAQDAASSLVNGMPGTAVRLDAATYVLPPPEIAAGLVVWAAGGPSRAPWPAMEKI